jgi:hypothetical protein
LVGDKSTNWTVLDTLKTSGHVDAKTRYPLLSLREPLKEEVLAWKPGQAFRRELMSPIAFKDDESNVATALLATALPAPQNIREQTRAGEPEPCWPFAGQIDCD